MQAEITIELYRLDVSNSTYTKITSFKPANSISYSKRRNRVGECSFDLSVFDPILTKANFIERSTIIVVKRNGIVDWFGPYFNFEGSISPLSGMVKIKAYSPLFWLVNRFTDQVKTYTQQDQGYIARNLIQSTILSTNGQLNITLGSETTGVLRNRTYENKSIADALIQLSDLSNGFDFDFNPVTDTNGDLTATRFNIYYPRMGSVRSDLNAIQLLDNIAEIGFGTNGELYNYGIGQGAGTGEGALRTTYAIADLQLTYSKVESFQSEQDISVLSTLQGKVQNNVLQNSVPSILLNFKLSNGKNPQYPNFSLGDTFNINIDVRDMKSSAGDLLAFKGQAQIDEIVVSYDKNGVETVIPKIKFYR